MTTKMEWQEQNNIEVSRKEKHICWFCKISSKVLLYEMISFSFLQIAAMNKFWQKSVIENIRKPL